MTSWLRRAQAGIQSAPTTPAVPGSALTPAASENLQRYRDPNAPDSRLDWEKKCVYERQLPGGAYITAHVTRLQEGFYDSPSTHGDRIDNVRFLAVEFVFHPTGTVHRFQSATVSLALHDDTNAAFTDPKEAGHRLSAHGPPTPKIKPKFLRFAPHVLFGGVSPETLDWNFNLTGNLGVSQTPVSASLSPSGGVKQSYKVYQMMRIQGSSRTSRDRRFNGSGYDMEDGEVVWTMEENGLQKSGLPREMTFVMLITKGDVENVVIDLNIEPRIASRMGHYPGWWCNFVRYQPLQKEHLDLNQELGQCFMPAIPGQGFNFANLASSFDAFVSLPGTTYSTTDQAFRNQVSVPDATTASQQQAAAAGSGNAGGQGKKQQADKAGGQSQSQKPQQNAQQQSGPSQQPTQQPPNAQNEPTDYHIYLHNPRTINLHATPPPPPPASAAPSAPSAPLPLPNPATLPYPVSPPRQPQTTAPIERTKSPMNTKLKRRSIDISNKASTNIFSPSNSQSGIRIVSGGSLRHSRSRTDLRASPLVEDSHSDCSQVSKSKSSTDSNHDSQRMHSSKEKISTSSPTSAEQVVRAEETFVIPMEAPSPPGGSSSMLSPPLPSSAHYTTPTPSKSANTRTRLPFELRRNHSDKDRPNRNPRSRDSPSPLRKRREITPSPNETTPDQSLDHGNNMLEDETIDMGIPDTQTSLSNPLTASQSNPIPASHLATLTPTRSNLVKDDLAMLNDSSSSRRERERTTLRELSPYAYANANGGARLDEDWDEAKGDLKRLRARKRMSLPANAHYSYITSDDEEKGLTIAADRDWEER